MGEKEIAKYFLDWIKTVPWKTMRSIALYGLFGAVTGSVLGLALMGLNRCQ